MIIEDKLALSPPLFARIAMTPFRCANTEHRAVAFSVTSVVSVGILFSVNRFIRRVDRLRQ
ncbi:hypothetical protein SOASR029_30970 [Budvicia aquatica]|nr:hypothetical protein SOASR029_30970 [Budvicia aquatica]